MECIVPTYVKNILGLRGFDNALSIKSLTDDDYASLETFARMKIKKYIPSDANHKDYYNIFCDEPDSFEILPRHIRLLKEIVKHITVTATPHDLSMISKSDVESSHSSQGSVTIESCKLQQRDFEQEPSQDKLDDVLETEANSPVVQEMFKALILEGSPAEFFIQLESDFSELDQLAVSLESASSWPKAMKQWLARSGRHFSMEVTTELLFCLRAMMVQPSTTSTTETKHFRLLYAKCQKLSKNSDLWIFYVRWKGIFSRQMIERFDNLSRDDAYDMKFVSKDSSFAIVQLFENGVKFEEKEADATKFVGNDAPEKYISDGEPQSQISKTLTTSFDKQFEDILESNKQFDEIIETMSKLVKENLPPNLQDEEMLANPLLYSQKPITSEIHKFIEPTTLRDDDFVIIRYVESPKLFWLQQTKNIVEYNAMMDKLLHYGMTAPALKKLQSGIACAARFKNDSEWYRAEIVNVNGSNVLVRFVDYEIELKTEISALKEIRFDFLVLPKKAVRCCLLGFQSLDLTTASSQQIMEILAENPNGDRRNFRVKIHGHVNESTLVNLIDATAVNPLNLSYRLLELSLPPGTFNDVKLKVLNKVPTITQKRNTSKTKAFISHIDRPDRFYLQCSSITDTSDQMQVNIQIVAPSLPALENFAVDTRCIGRTMAAIIDSDSSITSILFIDYGNTDTVTDNSLIKSMNDTFDQIPVYAIPCALPLEAKDRIEWSDESCELLKNLMDTELEFEYVCKGKSNNFVTLYQGKRDIMQELIQSGYAIKIDSIVSGANCYISHVNSVSDFYIQMERDTDALEKVADYLRDESKFEVMTDIKEGVVCAAKYADDGSWYRGKIRSHETGGTTEVFFIDYGNASMTNELRIIPTEIANAPALAKYCSMVKPKDIQYWSESAEARFVEITDNGTICLVDVISPGKQSIVDLVVDGKSILEDISNLCHKYTLSALEHTLQSDSNASEKFKALIVDGSPGQFYIQLESGSSELDQLCVALENASTWPLVDEVVVGQMCVGPFDGCYYRAKILSLSDQGAIVHYVDYGNQAVSTDLRKLPENLRKLRPLAILCSLETKNGTFSPQMIERFANLSRDDAYDMKFISKDSSPVIVQLFENGVRFSESISDSESL